MKFGQLIECNLGNIFLKKSFTKCGGETIPKWEVFPALFQNLKKGALILGKNALIRFIYRFSFSFKMLFETYLGKKLQTFFPGRPFIHMLQIKCLLKCPYSETSPALKNSWLCACQTFFLKNRNWAYLWIKILKLYISCFYCLSS